MTNVMVRSTASDWDTRHKHRVTIHLATLVWQDREDRDRDGEASSRRAREYVTESQQAPYGFDINLKLTAARCFVQYCLASDGDRRR